MRDVDSPDGISDAQERIASEVLRANKLVSNGTRVLSAASDRGAICIVECPVFRGVGSQAPLIGRERHASMMSYGPLVRWSTKAAADTTVFDQCMTGLHAMKTAQLISTRNVQRVVRQQFRHLKCNHSDHQSFLHATSGLQ